MKVSEQDWLDLPTGDWNSFGWEDTHGGENWTWVSKSGTSLRQTCETLGGLWHKERAFLSQRRNQTNVHEKHQNVG